MKRTENSNKIPDEEIDGVEMLENSKLIDWVHCFMGGYNVLFLILTFSRSPKLNEQKRGDIAKPL